MNTAEGISRLATVIRWIGDGLGILCVVGGLASFGNGKNLEILFIVLILGAFCSGAGRTISWILQGLAKSD